MTVSSTVKYTQNPKRLDTIEILTLSTLASGANVKIEAIGDIPGGVVYTKTISPASAASQKWSKVAIPEISFADAEIFAFDNLSSAHVVGKETLLSIPVWHIRGDIIGQRATSTCDVYVRQDTYFPAETAITESGDTSGETAVMYTYTAFNTGISIALPPDDQVMNH